ncbi:2496_t:CDS:2, partial [Funneliformis mosseae]
MSIIAVFFFLNGCSEFIVAHLLISIDIAEGIPINQEESNRRRPPAEVKAIKAIECFPKFRGFFMRLEKINQSSSAEQAIDQSHNNLNIKDIKGHILEIAWGRPRPAGPKSKVQAETFQI